jgi:hypothetical protein
MEEAVTRGVSDSFVFLERLMEDVSAVNSENLMRAVQEISEHVSYNSLNALLLTPQAIYGWRLNDTRSKEAARYEEYFTLFVKQEPERILVASEPLDASETWNLLPNKSFFKLAQGFDGPSFECSLLS